MLSYNLVLPAFHEFSNCCKQQLIMQNIPLKFNSERVCQTFCVKLLAPGVVQFSSLVTQQNIYINVNGCTVYTTHTDPYTLVIRVHMYERGCVYCIGTGRQLQVLSHPLHIHYTGTIHTTSVLYEMCQTCWNGPGTYGWLRPVRTSMIRVSSDYM